MRDDAEADRAPDAERELEHRLQVARPGPSAAFRGALGRRLAAEDPGYGPRPPRLLATVSALGLLAAALLGVGLLQALGRL